MKREGFVIAKTSYMIDAIRTIYLMQAKHGFQWTTSENIADWTLYSDPASALRTIKAMFNNQFAHPGISDVILICRYPGTGEESIAIVAAFTYRDDPNRADVL